MRMYTSRRTLQHGPRPTAKMTHGRRILTFLCANPRVHSAAEISMLVYGKPQRDSQSSSFLAQLADAGLVLRANGTISVTSGKMVPGILYQASPTAAAWLAECERIQAGGKPAKRAAPKVDPSQIAGRRYYPDFKPLELSKLMRAMPIR